MLCVHESLPTYLYMRYPSESALSHFTPSFTLHILTKKKWTQCMAFGFVFSWCDTFFLSQIDIFMLVALRITIDVLQLALKNNRHLRAFCFSLIFSHLCCFPALFLSPLWSSSAQWIEIVFCCFRALCKDVCSCYLSGHASYFLQHCRLCIKFTRKSRSMASNFHLIVHAVIGHIERVSKSPEEKCHWSMMFPEFHIEDPLFYSFILF